MTSKNLFYYLSLSFCTLYIFAVCSFKFFLARDGVEMHKPLNISNLYATYGHRTKTS